MRVLAVLVVLAAVVVGGVFVWRSLEGGNRDRHAAAERYATAWVRGQWSVMWGALTPAARVAYPQARFVAAYRSADRAAGVRSLRIITVGAESGGGIPVAVRVGTLDFGTLRGTIVLPVSGTGSRAGVDWEPSLRLPGLRRGEAVRALSGPQPRRAAILAADGTPLEATALGASIAGTAGPKPTGLERIYDRWVGGHPSEQLLFGQRVIASIPAVGGRSLRTTISPGLMAQAAAALGQQLGGIAVIRPRDGAVVALAGLAVSASQPPGSSFKIITASAALQHGVAIPSTRYPILTAATLSGASCEMRPARRAAVR